MPRNACFPPLAAFAPQRPASLAAQRIDRFGASEVFLCYGLLTSRSATRGEPGLVAADGPRTPSAS